MSPRKIFTTCLMLSASYIVSPASRAVADPLASRHVVLGGTSNAPRRVADEIEVIGGSNDMGVEAAPSSLLGGSIPPHDASGAPAAGVDEILTGRAASRASRTGVAALGLSTAARGGPPGGASRPTARPNPSGRMVAGPADPGGSATQSAGGVRDFHGTSTPYRVLGGPATINRPVSPIHPLSPQSTFTTPGGRTYADQDSGRAAIANTSTQLISDPPPSVNVSGITSSNPSAVAPNPTGSAIGTNTLTPPSGSNLLPAAPAPAGIGTSAAINPAGGNVPVSSAGASNLAGGAASTNTLSPMSSGSNGTVDASAQLVSGAPGAPVATSSVPVGVGSNAAIPSGPPAAASNIPATNPSGQPTNNLPVNGNLSPQIAASAPGPPVANAPGSVVGVANAANMPPSGNPPGPLAGANAPAVPAGAMASAAPGVVNVPAAPAAANAPAAPGGANMLAAPAAANAPGVPAAAANAPGVLAAAANAPGVPAGANAPSPFPGANAAASPLGVNASAPPAGANPVGQLLNYVMLNQMVSSPSNAGGAATPTNHASSSSAPVANPSGQTSDGSSRAGSASAPVASVGTSDSAANVPHPVVGVTGVGNATAGVNALGPSTVASTVNNGASGTNPTGTTSNRAVPHPMSGAPGNHGGAAIPARHSSETTPLPASSPRGPLNAASGIRLPGWEANTLDIASGKRPLFSEGSVLIPPSARVLADATLNQPAIRASDQVRQDTGIGTIDQTAEGLSIPQTVPEPAPLALLGITAVASAYRFVFRRFRRRT